ncbi:hypothetical protein AJ80_07668 [Polytolypa hystricis UAMH7299]|uniref:Uncharacterized protein n=1 Tax=Polytolypa hystricis (strain UAMH7299) TaxID=1447883 RepID=A0A2B7XL16_POLH7|nr:hypothetical protein AJ80_07668 [Polytolypa hystricis UAMH7299]
MYFQPPQLDGQDDPALITDSSMLESSTPEQRIPDPAMLKKRKRDIDSQENQDMIITPPAFTPHDIQHLDAKFRERYYEYTKQASAAARLRHPEYSSGKGLTQLRHRLQPVTPLKRRRLLQQQQLQTRNQQLLFPSETQEPQPNVWGSEHNNSHMSTPSRPKSPSFLLITAASTSIPSPAISPRTIIPSSHQLPNPRETSQRPLTSPLSPCHICHRRPTTRSVVDAYADCEICNERACYICLRECAGHECIGVSAGTQQQGYEYLVGQGGGRKICSHCAVEGVTECGEETVLCLDCLAGLHGDIIRS